MGFYSGNACPANQIRRTDCLPVACIPSCATKDEPIPCLAAPYKDCCCPDDKPILHADGIMCLSRDQCKPCPANQVYDDCCMPTHCTYRCDFPMLPLVCKAACAPGCCCPPPDDQNIPWYLAEDEVTCVGRHQCKTDLCADVTCDRDIRATQIGVIVCI